MDTDLYAPLRGLRVRYATLGCKLNFAETAALRDRLRDLGAEDAAQGSPAGLCIVNTCSVTGEAAHKSRQALRRLSREEAGAPLVAMGCQAQLACEELARLGGVVLVIGQEEKARAPRLIAEALTRHGAAPGGTTQAVSPGRDIRTFVPSCARGGRTRFFLKVQDGCDNRCSYCAIPFARGRSRNGRIADLVAQARDVAAQGGKEIVLTGVNIGDFGRTTRETLPDLLRALDTVEGIERYRISSLEPDLITDEVIAVCARSRAFMPHFHIPLQSGSDAVLQLMRRRYDTARFRDRVERILTFMPDAFIGVDVMAGARGETAEYFEAAFRYIESLPVAQLHVFTYSERPGTKALDIPYAVPPAEKHARTSRLLALSAAKHAAFLSRYVGTRRPVLWEHAKPGLPMHGYTDNYIRVEAATGHHPADNTIETVRLGRPTADAASLTQDSHEQ